MLLVARSYRVEAIAIRLEAIATSNKNVCKRPVGPNHPYLPPSGLRPVRQLKSVDAQTKAPVLSEVDQVDGS